MQTILIILALAVLALVVFGFVAIWVKLNERCVARYDYQPMNNWNLLGASVAIICMGVGGSMVTHESLSTGTGYNLSTGPTPVEMSYASLLQATMNQEFWLSSRGNGVVIAAIGLLLFGWIVLRIAFKTSLLSGMVAGGLLAVVGTLFFLVLLIIIVGIICAVDNSKRKAVVVSRY